MSILNMDTGDLVSGYVPSGNAPVTYALTAGNLYFFFVSPQTNTSSQVNPIGQLESSELSLFNPDGTLIGTFGDGGIGTNNASPFPHEAVLYFRPTSSGNYTLSVSGGITPPNAGWYWLTAKGYSNYNLDPLDGNAIHIAGDQYIGDKFKSGDPVQLSGSTLIVTRPVDGNEPTVINNASRVEFDDGTLVISNGTLKFYPGVHTAIANPTGTSQHYTLTASVGDPSVIAVQDKVGSDGTFQAATTQLQFTDQTIDTTNITKTAALPATQIVQLVDTYVAYFNRAPDAAGLDFWGGQLANGASFATIANGFSSSPEASALYPSSLSTSAFVTGVYTNVLGRNTDAGGLAFWTSELQSGAVTNANFVLNVVQSVLLQTGTTDAQYIANKEAVGAHFALTQGLSDGIWAKTVMAGVNGTAASVTAANALTDGFAMTAGTTGSSELVMKIVGIVA